ncbi:mRNA cleavage and polyadenylation factor IA/II complex [Beauveria brongniartii RCEF 3172]|uniref:Polynucleotide 5'-hydroxyl-kinase GRC3 n=1 Tax=Beauveria brongniartii RCEF 3172 TaxID=1081107 RepID=A0A162HVJ2_9HYPO|nr:mRNA cleavage and polyadenylation factor IA/II complex [Beauveria brongniartii RCEF 3172]
MSIPGLGQIPAPHVESTTRIVSLRKACEWRFQLAAGGSVSVKLLSGTAEKDGIELAPRSAYKFYGPVHGKLLTWHGCDIEVDGRTEHDATASFSTPIENPAASHLNLHAQLAEIRGAAARSGREGPRVLVAGGRATGKTTLARTLASYATRQGAQPLVVNADPGEGMLSLAGTLSAAVFATVMDPLAADGWGGTPTSGPSTVPVKLPLVYYYGRESAEADPEVYKRLFGRLADGVSARLSEDPDVKAAGVLVDSMGVDAGSARGLELLAHIVDELSVNIVVILGRSGLNAEIAKRFATEKTSLGEPIQVITLEKSDGVVDRDDSFTEHTREAVIKEYFFGDARRTLSPQIQQVDFDSLVIYRLRLRNGHAGEGRGVLVDGALDASDYARVGQRFGGDDPGGGRYGLCICFRRGRDEAQDADVGAGERAARRPAAGVGAVAGAVY